MIRLTQGPKGLTPAQGLLQAIWTDERFSASCVTLRNTEPILETYDAPALQILLGPAEVHVEPVGREVPFLAIRGGSGTRTEFAGRIDISDGLREYNLYRERLQDGDRWQMPDKLNRFTYLDRQVFERILEELLS